MPLWNASSPWTCLMLRHRPTFHTCCAMTRGNYTPWSRPIHWQQHDAFTGQFVWSYAPCSIVQTNLETPWMGFLHNANRVSLVTCELFLEWWNLRWERQQNSDIDCLMIKFVFLKSFGLMDLDLDLNLDLDLDLDLDFDLDLDSDLDLNWTWIWIWTWTWIWNWTWTFHFLNICFIGKLLYD